MTVLFMSKSYISNQILTFTCFKKILNETANWAPVHMVNEIYSYKPISISSIKCIVYSMI